MKTKLRNRIVSAVLALTMVASLLPAGLIPSAHAAVITSGKVEINPDTGHFKATFTSDADDLGQWAFILAPDVLPGNSPQGANAGKLIPSVRATVTGATSGKEMGDAMTKLVNSTQAISGTYFTGGAGSFPKKNGVFVIEGDLGAASLQGIKDAFKATGGYYDSTGTLQTDYDNIPFMAGLYTQTNPPMWYNDANVEWVTAAEASLSATDIDITLTLDEDSGEWKPSGTQNTTITNSGGAAAQIQEVTISGLPAYLGAPGYTHHLTTAGDDGVDLLLLTSGNYYDIAAAPGSATATYAPASWVDGNEFPYAYTATATISYVTLNSEGNPTGKTRTTTFQIKVTIPSGVEFTANYPSFTGTIDEGGNVTWDQASQNVIVTIVDQ